MNCDSCQKLNAVPQCFEAVAYSQGVLSGILTPTADADYKVQLLDIATGRITWIDVISDGDAYIWIPMEQPLMDHTYQIRLYSDDLSQQHTFTIESTEMCCAEFNTIENQGYPVNNFELSVTVCTTE